MSCVKEKISILESRKDSNESDSSPNQIAVKPNGDRKIFGTFHGGRDFPFSLILDCEVKDKSEPFRFLVKPETLYCIVEPEHAVVVAQIRQFNKGGVSEFSNWKTLPTSTIWKKIVIVFHCCEDVDHPLESKLDEREKAKVLTEENRIKTIGELTQNSGSKVKANCPVSAVIQVDWKGNSYWKLVEAMSYMAKGKHGSARKKQFDKAIVDGKLFFSNSKGKIIPFAQFEEENFEKHTNEGMEYIKNKLTACLKTCDR